MLVVLSPCLESVALKMFWKHCAFRVFTICDVLLAYFSLSSSLQLLLWIFSITDFTVAWYIVLFCKHLTFKGHSFFTSTGGCNLCMWFSGWFFFRTFFYYLCHGLDSNIPDFYCISIEYLVANAWWGKCLCMSSLNIFLHLFYVCLHGGSNHMMFLFLVAFFMWCVCERCRNCWKQ